jgi:hypothetical protein
MGNRHGLLSCTVRPHGIPKASNSHMEGVFVVDIRFAIHHRKEKY